MSDFYFYRIHILPRLLWLLGTFISRYQSWIKHISRSSVKYTYSSLKCISKPYKVEQVSWQQHVYKTSKTCFKKAVLFLQQFKDPKKFCFNVIEEENQKIFRCEKLETEYIWYLNIKVT